MTRKDHRQHWIAIAADPEDRTPWLIYADRLEEEGAADVAAVMRGNDIKLAAFDFTDGSIAFDLASSGLAMIYRLRISRDGLPALEQRSAGRAPGIWLAASRDNNEAPGEVGLPPVDLPPAPGSITPARLLRALVPRRRRLR